MQEVLKLIAQADSLSEFRSGKDALAVAKKALNLAKETHFALGEAKASYEIANAYYDLYESGDSIQYFANRALSIAQILKEAPLQGDVHIQLGRLYKRYGFFIDAARSYEKALTFRLQGRDSLKIATVYNNLSSVYLEFGQASTAMENADRAIQYWPKSNPTGKNRGYLASFYINYSNALGATGDPAFLKKAFTYSQKAISIAYSLKQEIILFEAYYGLGRRYYENGDYHRSIGVFQKALAKSPTSSDSIMTLEALAISSLSFNKLELALRYINDAEKLAAKNQDTYSLINIYTHKGGILSALGKYQASNKVLEQALNSANILNIGNSNQIKSRIQIEIAKNAKGQSQRMKNLILIGGSILVILILIFTLFYKHRFSVSERMASKHKLGEREALNILEGLVSKERDFKRLIHVAINGDLNTLRLSLMLAQREGRDIEVSKIIEKLEQVANRFRSQDNTKLTVEALLASLVKTAKNCIISPEIKMEFIPEINEAKGNVVKKQVFKCLESIVELAFTNIERHSNASKATLVIETSGNLLMIEIKDNGIGFDSAKIDESKSIGLQDIRNKIQEISGRCTIESTPGTGTTLKIVVPNPYEE